jgi:hypothetical protein
VTARFVAWLFAHALALLPRARAALRAGAASLALFALVGVGHVLPAFHFALVAHRVCAEHGELIHGGGLGRGKAERPVKVGVPEDGSTVVEHSAVAHEHEHCGVSAAPVSAGAVPAVRGHDFTLLGQALDATVGRALEAHVGIQLLAYAPKLAPPA